MRQKGSSQRNIEEYVKLNIQADEREKEILYNDCPCFHVRSIEWATANF